MGASFEIMHKFLTTYNVLGDLLSMDQVKQYRDLGYPKNIAFLNKVLEERLKSEPDFEVFVNANYPRYGYHANKKNGKFLLLDSVYVSNKGRVIQLRKDTIFEYTLTNYGNNKNFSYGNKGAVFKISSVRLMAHAFIPKPKGMGKIPYSKLQTVYKDEKTKEVSINNVCWATHQEKIKHRYDTGVFKKTNGRTILATVQMPGKYLGYRFIVKGVEQINSVTQINNGSSSVYACAAGKTLQSKGCKWKYISEEEAKQYIDIPIPEELIDLIKNYDSRKNLPILSKRISDKHLRLIGRGKKAVVDAGFTYHSVWLCLNGQLYTHKKHTFHHVKLEDIQKYQDIIANQTTTD